MRKLSRKSDSPDSQDGAMKIKIIGIGGAGANIIDRLNRNIPDGALTAAINTDAQALSQSICAEKLLVGRSVTHGLGVGGELDLGKRAAEADLDKIKELVSDMDLIILVVGLGGGTGSAAVQIAAEAAAGTGAILLTFATLPFTFEGSRRKHIAEDCIGELRKWVHGLIPLQNDMLLQESEDDDSVLNAFAIADRWIGHGVNSLCSMLLKTGLINQDLSTLRSIFRKRGGKTIFGIGSAEGNDCLKVALDNLLLCPLLHTENHSARPDRILVNITGGSDLSIAKINEIMDLVSKHFDSREDVVFGAVIDQTRKESLEICVLGKVELEDAIPEKTTQGQDKSLPFELTTGSVEQSAITQQDKKSRSVYQPKLTRRKQKTDETQKEFSFDSTDDQRGYFEKTERNEYKGEDLDVPTYLRHGVKIKLKF